MANCVFCGKPAGFLKKTHDECNAKHEAGWNCMVAVASESVSRKAPREEIESRLTDIANASFIPASRLREAIIQGWENSVERFLEDGNLDESEETRLHDYSSQFSLTQDDLDSRGAYSRLVKGAVLRDLLKGIIPHRVRVNGVLPFNFQKNEHLIWVFASVKCYEDRRRLQYVGASHGVSVRIFKGLYYRIGAFRGHPIETTETVFVGEGTLAVTNRHIYFGSGAGKGFRVAHQKIVMIQPFQDGVGIQRDAQTAPRQLFITGDGWFTYNLLLNVANV